MADLAWSAARLSGVVALRGGGAVRAWRCAGEARRGARRAWAVSLVVSFGCGSVASDVCLAARAIALTWEVCMACCARVIVAPMSAALVADSAGAPVACAMR